MTIWKTHVTAETLNARAGNSIEKHMGIEITEVGEDFISGKMPVDDRTRQPYGILHGGAFVVLAETLGSIGCNLCLDGANSYAVGLDINSNHIKSIRDGWVYGIARPIHRGVQTHVWEIKITNEAGNLLNISRLTMMVLKRP